MKFKNSLILGALLFTVFTISLSDSIQLADALPATLDMTAIDLEAGTISITVTDSSDGDDIDGLDIENIIVFDGAGQTGTSFAFTTDSSTDVSADPSLDTVITIGETDLYNIKNTLSLASTTFSLRITPSGISTDGSAAGSNVGNLDSTTDRDPTDDSSAPTLVTNALGTAVNTGSLTLTFSEGVTAPDPIDITIGGTPDYTLTASSTVTTGSAGDTVFIITLSEVDRYNINAGDGVDTDDMDYPTGLVSDGAGTAIVGVNGDALSATDDDTTPPTLSTIDLDLNAGTVDLVFNEGVDVPTVTGLTFGGDIDVPLTTSTVTTGTAGATAFTITLSVIDLYNINSDDSATSDVDYTTALTNDGADNTIAAVNGDALDSDIPDATPPTLSTNVLDLNANPGTLILTFSEGVDAPTPGAITLGGTLDVTLTGSSTVTSGANGATTFTITLGEDDRYNISVDDIGTDDMDFTAALTTDGTNAIVADTGDGLSGVTNDGTAPSIATRVLNLNANPGTLVLTFSEGVSVPVVTDINIDGAPDYDLTTSTVTAGSAGSDTFTITLSEIDRYTISVNDIDTDTMDIVTNTFVFDGAGNNALSTFNVAFDTATDDSTAPTVSTSVLNLNTIPGTLTLTFSEGVDVPVPAALTLGGTSDVTLTTSGVSSGANGDTVFTIQLSEIDRYNISADDIDTDDFNYTTGLALDGADNTTGTVNGQALTTATDDVTAPTFTASRTSATQIILTFSEFVDSTTVLSEGWALSNGGTISASSDPAGTSDTITLTFSGIPDTGITPTVTYDQGTGTVLDGANNEVGEGDNAVAADNAPPTWSSVHTTLTTTTVTFSEFMDGTLQYSDWNFGGANPTDDSAGIGDGGSLTGVTAFVFTHPALAETDTEDAIFLDIGTVDVTDNSAASNPLTTLATLVDEEIAPTFTADRTALNSITLTFSEDVTSTGGETDNFTVVDATTVTAGAQAGGTTIVLTTTGLTSTSSTPNVAYVQANGDVADTDDSPTLLIEGANANASDSVAPTFTALRTSANTFELTISEPVSGTAILNSFTVAGSGDVTNTAPSSSTSITLTTTGLTDTSGTLAVEYIPGTGDILDDSAQLNELSAGPVNAVDGAPPTFTADRTALNSITLTFSEDITSSGPDANNFLVSGAATVEAAGQAGGTTIVLTTTGLTATDGTPTVTYDQLQGNVQDQATVANLLTNGANADAADSVAPTMVSAVTTSSTTVEVTFSEDIDNASVSNTADFTVAGASTTIASGVGSVVTLTVVTPFATDATPQIILLANDGIDDVPGNTLASDLTGVTAADNTSPTFTVSRTAANSFTVTTSEDVTGTQISGSFTVDGAVTTTNSAVTTDTTITLTTTGLTATDGTPAVTYNPGTGDILDNSAALNELVAGPVNAVDNAPPTFTADRTALNTIVLTFTEDVNTPGTAGDGYDVDGATVTGNSDPQGTTNIITLTTTGLTATDGTPLVTYTQAAGTTVDVSAQSNEVANNESANADDSVAPTFTAERTALNTIVLSFSEPISTTTSPDTDSFTVTSPLATTVSAFDNGDDTITLTTTGLTATDGTPQVDYVAASGDVVDGNGNAPANGGAVLASDSVTPTFTAERTDINTIELTFSENVSSIGGTDDFTVVGGGTVTHGATGGATTTIELTTTGFASTDTSQTPLVTYAVNTGSVVDVSVATNEVVNGESATASDSVAPVISSIVTGPTADDLTFTFSEAMDESGSIIPSDFGLVDGHVPDSLSVSGAVVTVTYTTDFETFFTEVSNERFGAPGVVEDVPGNALSFGEAGSSAAIGDGLSPTFSVTTNTLTSLTLTFSEGIDAGTFADADWTVEGGAATIDLDGVAGAGQTTAVLTHAPLPSTGTLPSVIYTPGNLADQDANTLSGTSTSVSDGIAPVIATTSPLTLTDVNDADTVDFTMTENLGSGSITFTVTGAGAGDANSPHVYALSGTELLEPGTSISIATLNADATFITGGQLVDGAVYDITINGQDTWGMPNFAITSTTLAVTYDISGPVFSSVAPATLTFNNDAATVEYTLDEAIVSGTITFTGTGGSDNGVAHVYDLAGVEFNSGATSITFANINARLTADLVTDNLYTIEYDGVDAAGNAATTVTTTNVTYDTTLPTLTPVGPAQDSENNDADTVDFDVSETLTSGTVTFTHESGTADGNSPHTFTIIDLTPGAQSITFADINTGLTNNLVDGAFYTVTYDATDLAGNVGTTETTTGVKYDVTAPIITPVTISSDGNLGYAKDGDTITVTLTSDELLTVTSQSINGLAADVGINNALTVTATRIVDGTDVDGATQFAIQVEDPAGNPATLVDDVTGGTAVVIDTELPIVTGSVLNINAGSTTELTLTDEYTEAGTATDAPHANPAVTVQSGGIDTTILGSQTVVYEATDLAGNVGTDSVETEIIDTTGPSIGPVTIESNNGLDTTLAIEGNTITVSITGDEVLTITGTPTINGETATIGTNGATTVTVTRDVVGGVDPEGTSTFSITVQDPGLNPVVVTAITTGSVVTVDTTDPTFDLVTSGQSEGGSFITNIVKDFDTYTPDTFENQDDGIGSGILSSVVTGDTVDETTLGTTIVTYTVSDNAGNTSIVTETVNVIEGGIPVITLTGADPINIIKDIDTYTELGATTIDTEDGAGVATVGGQVVDESTVAVYTVTYDFTDSSGNAATQVTRTVNVVAGDIPVLTLVGDAAINVEVQSTYVESGATATDTEDDLATIPLTVVIGGDTVDTGAAAGTVFTVTYDVTDSSGNAAVQLTRDVTITDTTIPIITLTGTDTTVAQFTTYADAGATAFDVDDGDITGSIITVNNVNTDNLGVQTVTYNVVDSQTNAAVEVVRNVEVTLGDAPILTLTGAASVQVRVNSAYADAGATCSDTEDGDLTSGIVTTGSINTGVLGAQTITLTCTDASGNSSESVRTVTVLGGGGGGNDRAKTAPTSGLDWNTYKTVVEGGIVANGVTYDIEDNWHTDFVIQQTGTGEPNTFTTKTWAQNGGLFIHEIAFGVPEIGSYDDAEALVEVWYNYDKTIDKVVVVQETEVVDVTSLNVTTNQVECRADADAMCYETNFDVIFREPLQNDVFAIKSVDMTRRSMMPTYLNDGLLVNGESLNPMKTLMIPGTDKYEGLVEITQSEKYSDFWFAADGRIFEMFGESDSFKLVPQEKLERIDTGKVDNRNHSAYESYKEALAEEYKQIFDSSKIQSLVPESFSYDFPDVDSRTQFLIDNGLIDYIRK